MWNSNALNSIKIKINPKKVVMKEIFEESVGN